MLLRLTASPAEWTRLAAALDATGSPVLAGVVRAMLVAAPNGTDAGPVALAFTPAQTGELQRVAAAIGLALPATPVTAEPEAADWVAPLAERAEAVAAADSLISAYQRLRTR